jgi:hypothetical protein
MRKLVLASLAAGLMVGVAIGQTPPEPPTASKAVAAPCGCTFVCRAHRTGYEMDLYHARESRRAEAKVEAANAEYYRRTGRKPVPYWDMPY